MTKRQSPLAKRGRVLSQSPKRGAVRRNGYPVRLVVGRK
jgi:beta-lactam-binding protein with PASTA domain